MSKVTASVTFEENNRKLIEKAAAEAVERGLAAIGMEAVTLTHRDKANRGTPVDTGRLRNSINWATQEHQNYAYDYEDDNHKTYSDKARSGVPAKTLVIGTNVEYGQIIEEGSARIRGAHMLRNALTDGADRWEAIMKANLEAAEE